MQSRKILAGLMLMASMGLAQQPNSLFSSLAVDTSPLLVLGQGPTMASKLTDSQLGVHVLGFPGTPLILLGGQLAPGSVVASGLSLDLALPPAILLDGNQPASPARTDPISGVFSASGLVPSCPGGGPAGCTLPATFSFALQAVTTDPTNLPLGFNLTGAAQITFINGHQELVLTDDDFGVFDFRDGFTFPFYGNTYTRAFVSSNGYVSFTPASTGFPNPTVTDVLSGTPRIMTFYDDLVPQLGGRVFARQVEEDGVRKVRFVHFMLAEFGNATGPHGGESVITEAGDISVFVASYNPAPSINTVVGITPGLGIDGVGALATPFGRDLSADVLAGPTVLGQGRSGFELYDHGLIGALNPIDVIGFRAGNGSDVGPGIVFRLNPATPNSMPQDTSYVIE